MAPTSKKASASKRPAKSYPKKAKGASKKPSPKSQKKTNGKAPELRLLEKRKHPRFLLSGEQFRELRTGKIYPVYDLSLNGLSIKVEEKNWKPGMILKGVLNLHPDSIEVTVRFVDYYGDRAALKMEMASTYARSVLLRALSPKRLGTSLRLVREKLPFADFWYHGACNTDLLLKLDEKGGVTRAEVFFSNFFCSWIEGNSWSTGVCQSMGREKREDILLGEEPVTLESIHLSTDLRIDTEKMMWAKGILENSPLDVAVKDFLLKKFSN